MCIRDRYNLPLLNDEGRKTIGIKYKQEGHDAAVEEGFKIVGPYMADLIAEAKQQFGNKHLIIYCWRGGLRSKTMGWLLSMAGFSVTIIKGGYKAYRHEIRDYLDQPFRFLIVGGKTGTGKTAILNALLEAGEPVIDLEALAHHNGSSYGGLGHEKQPSIEQFENNLVETLLKFDLNKPIWIENESKKIGTIAIHPAFFNQMESAPVFNICIPFESRVKRIVNEYGRFGKEELSEATMRIGKRLGPQHLKEALGALEDGNLHHFIKKVLVYYDKTYTYGLSKRRTDSIKECTYLHDKVDLIAKDLIELKKTNFHQ